MRPGNVFVGVGSDEAIVSIVPSIVLDDVANVDRVDEDALLRCFCTPGRDKILTCPPTYGMYAVSAQVNDLGIAKVPLDTTQSFKLQPGAVNEALSTDPAIKMVYVCSPGNPTANLVSKSDLEEILTHPTWNGIVVLDEAYIDFSPDGSSLAEWVTEWPNLVVMQTLSKAFGLAGIRLGAAFASPEVASLLNNLKAPYNISTPTSALACAALEPGNLAVMRSNREKIMEQRNRMLAELPRIPGIGNFLGGADSNFLLVEILDKPRNKGGKPSNQVALALYERLAETQGVVVRFRGKEVGCYGCLRITVGTKEEVDKLFARLADVIASIHRSRDRGTGEDKSMNVSESEANNVIA